MKMTQEQVDAHQRKHGFLTRTTRNETNNRSSISNAELECNQEATLGSAIQGEASGVQRAIVSFTGYRVKPLDPDNFAGSVKDILDGLRHAGLISGDEPWRIILRTDQVKVSTYKEEKTVISIER